MKNDPRLGPLIASGGGEEELRQLLVGMAMPLIRRIVSRSFRGMNAAEADADDLESMIHLRLLHKLRRVATSPAETIQDLDSYIATLSYNVVNDHLRRRYPERTRLKNRLRYVLSHDPRLALWSAPAGIVAGLKEWRGAAGAATVVPLDPSRATRRMRDREHLADALHALLEAAGTPIELEAVVEHTAALWHVVDVAPSDTAGMAEEPRSGLLEFERRELLRALWREVVELRAAQRKALLLNLRDDGAVNVVALLVLTGTAKFHDIAAALELSPEELSEIWNDLPLDDLQIARLLGVTRQQVINLRKSARERLRRRFRNNRSNRTS